MNAHRYAHKTEKTEVIRARCDSTLKSLAHRAACRTGLDLADIIRMGTLEFATRVLSQKPELPCV